MRQTTYNRVRHRHYKPGNAMGPYTGAGIFDVFRRIGSTAMNLLNTRLGQHVVQGIKNVGQRAVTNIAQNLGNLISNPKPTATTLLQNIGQDALRQTMTRIPQYMSGSGIKPNPLIINRGI